jgi:CcmD family protein
MKNLGYLFAAYTAVWLGIVLYVRHLGRRTAELHEELRELREKLERR